MATSESVIYFGCPRCTAPLKAPARKAGQRRRCPVCQYAVEVPQKSRRADYGEYGVGDAHAAEGESEPEIAFECPICHTRMTAPKKQIGTEVPCPDCHTRVTVPATFTPRRRREVAPQEAYDLCADEPASPSEVPQQYVPCYCGRCSTLIQVPSDRVGSEVTCPDCGAVQVAQLPRLKGKRVVNPTGESYEVQNELGPSPPESVANKEHVGFLCQCGTRLHALATAAGQKIVCPACGRAVTIPSRLRKRPKPVPSQESKEQYEIRLPVTDKQVSPTSDRPPLWFSERFRRMVDEKGRWRRDPPPPRWPLFSGVFTFPWRRGSFGKWLRMSFVVMPVALMVVSGNPVFLLLGSCLLLFWAGMFFAHMLAILVDTAAGADEVGEWPDALDFFRWASSTFLVISSLWLTVGAGVGIEWLMRQAGLPIGFALPIFWVLLFPVVLLSMLEANSPLVPLSLPVCRSLLNHRRVLIGFYAETILLVIVTAGLVIASLRTVGSWIVPLGAMTIVASSMIYFRLLGRLAWCCSEHSEKDDNEDGHKNAPKS